MVTEVKPYNEERPKGEQVEAMFDNIAPAYDFMNTAMTFRMHRRWLRKALEAAGCGLNPSQPHTIVDLATGTGDVAFRLAERYPEAEITGIDLSEGMLEIARKKSASHKGAGRVRFETGDCMALDYPDDTFDLLTIAYGVRNFEDLDRGFREFHRVLKPGGRAMILELSRPENPLARAGYDLYTKTFIPLAGKIISKDRRAYSYLPESIKAMPPRRRIAEMLEEAGFRKTEFKSMTLGAVTYYLADK